MLFTNRLHTTFILFLAIIALSYSSNASTLEALNPGTETTQTASMSIPMSMTSSALSIDPNNYNFLVYDCGTDIYIRTAMNTFGITPTYRDADNPVTANDLDTHDILIVSWSAMGDTSGLDPNIILDGITGTVLLTGHDLDYHTGHQDNKTQYAEAMFAQAIDYVLSTSSGTCLIGLADMDTLFEWLPVEWGVEAAFTETDGETINSPFTQAGLDSGVFDGVTPTQLSGWGTSYHNIFTEWSEEFEVFEYGGGDANDVITIAAENIRPSFSLIKYDNITGCVSPYDANEITYTIEYSLDIDAGTDATSVVITDHVPAEIDPFSITVTGPGSYDLMTHTVTWILGTLSPGNNGSVSFTGRVTEQANPFGTIHNWAEITGSIGSVTADEYTNVCLWNPPGNPNGIIYVDKDATGYNNGTSWQHAYVDLQSALARARSQADAEIWVAEGSYYPTQDGNQNISFALVDDAEIYGGFKGNETLRTQRDFTRNKTSLCGDISATDEDPNSNYVVTAGNGVTDSAILDGFIVCRGVNAGIRLYDQDVMDQLNDPNAEPPTCDISPNIENCFITQNNGDGIHGQLADPNIYACIISDNGAYGIVDANSIEVEIDRCVIRDNGLTGIYAHVADSGHITNCFIHHNADGIYCYGINEVDNETYYVTIRNNTIVYNDGLAVEAYIDNMPVVNSILWGNSDPNQIERCLPDYCFIDANTIGTTNYYTDPGFAYTEPNACNYHLAADSDCIDAGDPAGSYLNEKDIDGEARIYTTRVDVGADEVTDCDDVYNPIDVSGNGIVNLIEYSLLSSAWLSYDPCSPPDCGDPNCLDDYSGANFDIRCDYDLDGWVDTNDLDDFASEWLWQACWSVAAKGTWFELYSTGSSQLAVEGLPSAAVKMCVPSAIPVGGEAMMSMPMSAVTTAPDLPTLETQLLQTTQMIDFLNMIYKDQLKQKVDKKTWNDFMNYLETWAETLAEDYLKNQDL